MAKLTKAQILAVDEPRSVHLIGVVNSWGDRTGDKGWQWLSADYFQNGNVWYGWTLAWDYKPALHKTLLIKVVGLLQQLFAVLSSKK